MSKFTELANICKFQQNKMYTKQNKAKQTNTKKSTNKTEVLFQEHCLLFLTLLLKQCMARLSIKVEVRKPERSVISSNTRQKI